MTGIITTGPALMDTGIDLRPDCTRVVTRFFVAGREDAGPGESRAATVIERILGLDEQVVEATMGDIDERFCHRYEFLHDAFEQHASMVMARLEPGAELSAARRLLLGASFTHEYSIEAAALCNPSIVLHPQQDTSGVTAFVLSVRGIGEGHRSTIGFRTGKVSRAGIVTVDRPGPYPRTVTPTSGLHHRSAFHAKLAELDDDHENAAQVLDPLPAQFDDADLEAGIDALAADFETRRNTARTIANLRNVARSSYRVEFPTTSEISERVLWPHAPIESHGMEDARFVRFTGDTGEHVYYATYTAYNGDDICVQLLETTDFVTFTATPMAGPAAGGKGFALFPRKIGGRYVALSRSNRETNAIASSDDLCCWGDAHTFQIPERPWEILQLGNCGSPIETAAGWLVLTHGVGPMRSYSIGALLLDLDDPRLVLARSETPLLAPGNDRRDGYVPNVVYSCGALAVGDLLVLPYGVGDRSISIATLSIEQLLSTMRPIDP